MKTLEQLCFDNVYARLPAGFYAPHSPQPLAGQHLVHYNAAAGALIGLDPAEADRDDFVESLCGPRALPGFEPLAMAYAGHQFGHLVPQLGDGRAILLGQVRTDEGDLWDLQLKGAGPTRYSRNGDGRAVLRSTIREYLCSEAMQGLGIPTTRALCMTGSREEVYRECIEPGAMLLRMAPSHVRFGSFEYFYYAQRYDDLRCLAGFVLDTYYPALRERDNPCLALLRTVVKDTAHMIAAWQAVGFAHGVMNSDNMSIHGLTLDYGPFGFMEAFDPGFICNHSDHHGRYAFDRQPDIGLFNLSCLAQALLPLLDDEPEQAAEMARDALNDYQACFTSAYTQHMRDKLGFRDEQPEDQALLMDLWTRMQAHGVDYTRFFRELSTPQFAAPGGVRDLFIDREACDAWLVSYQARLRQESWDSAMREQHMRQVNPKYILRNYLAELAIRKATEAQDYSEIDRLMKLLQAPFDEHPGQEDAAAPAPDWARDLQVSCSS